MWQRARSFLWQTAAVSMALHWRIWMRQVRTRQWIWAEIWQMPRRRYWLSLTALPPTMKWQSCMWRELMVLLRHWEPIWTVEPLHRWSMQRMAALQQTESRSQAVLSSIIRRQVRSRVSTDWPITWIWCLILETSRAVRLRILRLTFHHHLTTITTERVRSAVITVMCMEKEPVGSLVKWRAFPSSQTVWSTQHTIMVWQSCLVRSQLPASQTHPVCRRKVITCIPQP